MTSIILLALFVTSCHGVEFSSNARNFSLELMYFTHLDHFVMSPFCVWSVMTGAYLGGRGETKYQIQRAAILPASKTKLFENYRNLTNTIFLSNPEGVELASTTFLFHDINTTIVPNYIYRIMKILKAELTVLDFKETYKAKNVANRNIQLNFPLTADVFHTDDFINTSVIMSNVIHFRGRLSTPFNASYTTEEIIYNLNNTAIGTVSMMYQKGKLLYSNFESMSSHILELPYGNDGKFCMLVIFPYTGTNPVDVYRRLERTSLKDIFMKLEKDLSEKSEEESVKMPRFRMRQSLYLNKPLNDMGVFDAFEPDLGQFEDIDEDGLFISTVEHKADIIFAEAETVAFGSTPGYFDNQRNLVNVKAHQPFIFFLMEKPTASIIFGGIYSRHRYVNELYPILFPKDD